MAARDRLIAYGYVLCDDGKYRRPNKLTQVWQELEDGKGWLRFDPDGQGNEIPEARKLKDEFSGSSGLSKVLHPGTYEWVYPEHEVEMIYRDAVEAAAKWAAEAAARKGTGLATTLRAEEAAPTPDQLASMQNAQAGQAAAAPLAEKPGQRRHWWRRG